MQPIYLISFGLAFLVSLTATFFIIRTARRRKIFDLPDMIRRFHGRPVPTLGGLAIYCSFFLVSLVIGIGFGYLLHGKIPLKNLVGIWIGGAILMIGGYFDDKYRLPALKSIVFPILASLVLVFAGVHAFSVHNPLTNQIIVLAPFVSGLVVFLWTMTMVYTTKLLDGMDGLVTGIGSIAALVLFGISLSSQVMQSQTALLAIIFAGSLLGFLILNFYPAKIFLGEGGSTFIGFMLAVLAVVSGGKIATALLVMGIPLLDMIFVVLQRIIKGQSPFLGDRRHLHFKLTESGLSEPQAVIFLYILTAIFGGSALFLQSRGKFIALIVLFLVMLAIVASIFSAYKTKNKNYE